MRKRVFRKQPKRIYIFEMSGALKGVEVERGLRGPEKDSFCGCSIPTVFNQRWIFLKRDQMKQERKTTTEKMLE
jgi:hypothetical protein